MHCARRAIGGHLSGYDNIGKMLRILFSLLCIFSFGFIEALDSKLTLNTLKKVLRQPWNALMLQVSLLLRDKQHCVFFASLYRQKRRSLIHLYFCKYSCGFRQLK